ncbi:mucin-2-like [Culicoides brevitarsis]|uniref:mucin-2-like n=1 Tax=Culicoides brevitarsis TaxID=469753 RepID=UPI00307BB302
MGTNWLLFFSLCLILPALSTPFDDTPVDYLVPPPVASSRAIPGPSSSHQNIEEPPSFFNRLTNWMFSFGRSYEPPRDKIIAAPSEKIINYQKPAKPFHSDKNAVDDPSCSPCNKIPWVPIFPKNTPQTPNDLNRPLPPIKFLASTLPPTTNQYLPPSSVISYQPPTPTSSYQSQNSFHSTSITSISFSTPSFFGPSTTSRPLDFEKFTFTTTQRPFRNQEPFRGVTSPEYLPPRQVLPIENENRPYAPIPLPNLSMTPIPPLHEAKPFLQDPYRNAPNSGSFIPTFSNGTKYIEGLNVRMPPILTPFTSPNVATAQNSPNVEIHESLPVLEFQHTTIEDNYDNFKTTSQANFYQFSTSTSRPVEISTLSNIYRGKLTENILDPTRQPSILDTPIMHFNKSETNVLPIIVSYHNNETNNSQNTQNSIITQEKVKEVKPLRYIIPYTTQQRPQPFRAKNLRNQQGTDSASEFSEWAPQRSLDQDLHDTQESAIVTATAPTPPSTIKTTKFIAKFLASSIKELLNKEKIERIDTTEGTTTEMTTEEAIETTTEVPTTTTTEEITTTTSTTTTTTAKTTPSTTMTTKISTTTTEKPPSTTTKIESVPFDFVTFQENINKWTEEQFAETNEIPGSATTLEMVKYTKPIPVEYITESTLLPKITVVTPQNYFSTTTPSSTQQKSRHRPTFADVDSVLLDRLKSSFKQAKAYSSYSYRNEQWKKAQLTISPITKEKIYIVTPETITNDDEDAAEIFPRFKKRPTPGRGMNFS